MFEKVALSHLRFLHSGTSAFIYVLLMKLLMCAVAAQVLMEKCFFKSWKIARDAILPWTTALPVLSLGPGCVGTESRQAVSC